MKKLTGFPVIALGAVSSPPSGTYRTTSSINPDHFLLVQKQQAPLLQRRAILVGPAVTSRPAG